MMASQPTARSAHPFVGPPAAARLVLAVPVAQADSIIELKPACEDIICLATSEPFYAVGQHYRDFTQTEDDEVVRLLDEAQAWASPAREQA
jgi:putative phosphoribosyl transferase